MLFSTISNKTLLEDMWYSCGYEKDMKIVVSFVCIDAGHVLIQHRSDDKRTHPSEWNFGTGTVEPGEQPLQALLRELKEEYDVQPRKKPLLIDARINSGPDENYIALYYFTPVHSNHVVNKEPDKIQSIEWYPAQDFSLKMPENMVKQSREFWLDNQTMLVGMIQADSLSTVGVQQLT
jgi:8-oxo-dGTP pyrophosphatase MutT (NUDIX family)